MKFNQLKLIDPILKALQAEGYETATPIQQQAIPLVLERKDVLACAQTGTGKTAAFALPILQLLAQQESAADAALEHGNAKRFQDQEANPHQIRVLILTPTRELASQIAESFTNYGQGLPFKNTVIFGGVGQKLQVKKLRQGVDVLIATPGRLLDLMQQRIISFKHLQFFVLDEADRMLDMGFIHSVRKIIAGIPKTRQTLFFSATMPPEIRQLSEQILTRPVRIEVTPVASTAEKIQQGVFHVDKKNKIPLLIHQLANPQVKRALVFTRTKRDANRVSESLNKHRIRSEAIHGNKSQAARERALESIKSGESRVLVATDIAARGIDIDQVTHVFNIDIPNVAESYVHRIGRTARAGASGQAFSFCSPEEFSDFVKIERLINQKIPIQTVPSGLEAISGVLSTPAAAGARRGGGNNNSNSHGSESGGGNRARPSQPRNPEARERREESSSRPAATGSRPQHRPARPSSSTGERRPPPPRTGGSRSEAPQKSEKAPEKSAMKKKIFSFFKRKDR